MNNAFKVPFFTFVVAFAVMCSGLASAATLSRAFAGDYLGEFITVPVVLAAIVFLLIVALINFRGISESVKLNMGLTAIEVIGLIIIIFIGGSPSSAATGTRGATSSSPPTRASRSPSSAAPRSPSTR